MTTAYRVESFRAVGLEAKWGRSGAAPIILARNPSGEFRHQRETWWVVDAKLWEVMLVVGIREGFDRATLLGDLFSVRA